MYPFFLQVVFTSIDFYMATSPLHKFITERMIIGDEDDYDDMFEC